MAWETALDRLILRQIHHAERGEVRVEEVRAQLEALRELAPERAESSFHIGYGRVLLGLDLRGPEGPDPAQRRFHELGRLRGHERRGERNWVADLVADQTLVLDLLSDPRIATQVLPLVVRNLFWSGELTQAVQAIDFLASSEETDSSTVVEASLADLLTRLESREDPTEGDTTASILQRCIELPCFNALPNEVRAGYLHELGRRLLGVSEFDEALTCFEAAFDLASDLRCMRSRIALGAALAHIRMHDVEDLRPAEERSGRDEAMAWIERVGPAPDVHAPEALFMLGIFAYETGDHDVAVTQFDECTRRFRRIAGRDAELIPRNEFFLASSLLVQGDPAQSSRALRLMETSLGRVRPDLESFYSVHEALKKLDRKLALQFLDAVDVGRGTAPDQLLLVGLEYQGLGEAEPAMVCASRVLEIAVDLDQRIEAMQILLTAHNMLGDRERGRGVYEDMRDLLVRRGEFVELEKLLLNEDSVGQALDHLEIKCELVDLYEEMEDREFEKAQLQSQIARSLRARKDADSLLEARGLLREVGLGFPELAHDELAQIEGLLELMDPEAGESGVSGDALCAGLSERLGRRPRVLVVGGNERQRRHHPRFEQLAADWGFDGEWLMANYSSPQKLVGEIGDRIEQGAIDLLLMLHWNRHETTEPALDLARKAEVPARTVHYAGFTSLQVALGEQLGRLNQRADFDQGVAMAGAGAGRGKQGGKSRQR